jgi:hypothetical protein
MANIKYDRENNNNNIIIIIIIIVVTSVASASCIRKGEAKQSRDTSCPGHIVRGTRGSRTV